MKKIVALITMIAMVCSIITVSPIKAETLKNINLTLDKTYSDSIEEPSWYVMSYNSHVYTFTVSQSADYSVAVTGDVTWQLASTTSSLAFPRQQSPSTKYAYLPKNNTYSLTISGKGKYTVKVTKNAIGKISLKSKSTKMSGTSTKTVPFTFTGSSDHAKAVLSVTSSNKKVATVTSNIEGGTNKGSFTITPGYYGKSVITLKFSDSNTVKYTVYVTTSLLFVAKGFKGKVTKPIGVKKPKWSSKKKKIVSISKKSGKVKVKKGGRATLIAKKGKIKYKLKVISTDYIKLAKAAYKEIKDNVNNPDKLKIYNVYRGYSKQIINTKIPVVFIDYGSTNSYGAMVRSKAMAFYDEVHEMHITYGISVNNIIGKKSIKKSRIK